MKLLIVLALVVSTVNSANILVFSHTPAISHQFVFRAISRELSLRGHRVTFVTSNPMADPSLTNLTEIDISISYEIFKNIDASVFNREANSIFKVALLGLKFTEDLFMLQMSAQCMKDLLKQPQNSYDLLVVEVGIPAYHALQHKFKAPLVAVSSYSIPTYLHATLGNPVHPLIYTGMFSDFSDSIRSIWRNFDNLFIYLLETFFINFFGYPKFDEIARTYFGDDMPYIQDLMRETSLTISNVNPIISDRRPLAPNVIEVWNLHLNRTEDPPTSDIRRIVDEAKNGFVYFSLGTNVRFEQVGAEFKENVLKALGQLPFTVLCKWQSEDHPGKPKNVVLRKWFPQQFVMSHPNLKVFVTQGGLQSSEEAIINGVPLVIIPFLGDQPKNARLLTEQGMAETISPSALTADILKNTILKVENDKRFVRRPHLGINYSEYRRIM
ncbi:hypothetical protein WA026_018360 [Henosepilachna vigintioctopunctata]|uniref:UDP-glucuronosyltransferase n=1 Tax=Henosepilachna vigintioctopunctata TaxID=420089 RepID=A0AAW1VHA7_9CUCU